jgi:hypothetical protein
MPTRSSTCSAVLLPDNLSHRGCEVLSVQRNQGDRSNVVSHAR